MTRVANREFERAGVSALILNASKTKAMICGYKDFIDSIPICSGCMTKSIVLVKLYIWKSFFKTHWRIDLVS